MAKASAGRGFSGISTRLDPNGKGQSFLIAGLEGVVLLAIALYMVISPDSARDNIRLIAGLVFLAAGCYQLQRAFRFYHANTHRSAVPIRFIGGSFMLFGGILIVLEKLTGHFNIDAAQIVLASTLIAAGLFGIAAGLLGRRDGDFKLANIVASVILIVLAGFNISEVRSGNDQTRTIGVIVLLLGVALIGYAYLLRQRALDQPAVVDESTTYIVPRKQEAPTEPSHETYDAPDADVNAPDHGDFTTAVHPEPAENDQPPA